MPHISFFIVDDHALVRSGLRCMLSEVDGWTVVGEAEDGLKAVSQLEATAPDVILMETALPRLNGAEVARHAIKLHPHLKILAYSKVADQGLMVRVMQAGAAGFLSARCDRDELIQAVETVMGNNDVYVSPDISSLLVRSLATVHPEQSTGLNRLTERERQVLQLIGEGLATRDVARELAISEKTVESHRQHILQKLELNGLAELIHFAIREGIARL